MYQVLILESVNVTSFGKRVFAGVVKDFEIYQDYLGRPKMQSQLSIGERQNEV